MTACLQQGGKHKHWASLNFNIDYSEHKKWHLDAVQCTHLTPEGCSTGSEDILRNNLHINRKYIRLVYTVPWNTKNSFMLVCSSPFLGPTTLKKKPKKLKISSKHLTKKHHRTNPPRLLSPGWTIPLLSISLDHGHLGPTSTQLMLGWLLWMPWFH